MARLNIEDEFFDDVAAVGARMGDIDRAAGQALRLIRYAQTQIKKGVAITYQDFSERFSDMLMPEFARRVGDMIEVRGAKTHFAWLDQKREAGSAGGKESAKRPRNSKGQLTKAKQTPSDEVQAKPSDIQPSYSSSYSSSYSDSHSNSSITQISPKANANDFIVAYCDRFKGRWGENPHITGKDAGIAKRLGKTLSLAKFSHYLDAFFEMPDAWLVKIKHPLSAFETKLNEIVVFANTGQFTTNKQSQQADESVSNALLMRKIDEGKI